MRKYEVFRYIEVTTPENEVTYIPISIGFVYMSGKHELSAVALPNHEEWGYSYVEERKKRT
jgi:hypothetical protein